MNQDQDSLSAVLTNNPKPRRWHWPRPTLVLALVVIITAGSTWLHQQRSIDELEARMTENLAQQTQRTDQAQAATAAAQAQLRTVQQQLALLSAKTAEAQSQQSSLTSMYDTLTRSDTQRALAETEQNLTWVSQQLQFSGNVALALNALDSTDRKLQELNKPELISLRQAITRDADKLKALPVLDTAGIVARLNSLLDTLDQLPFAVDVTPQVPASNSSAATPKWLGALGTELWADLKTLIQIRRMDKPDADLLSANQALFLRENMKLRLLDARTALLMRDQDAFRADLTAVNRYLQQYFDDSTKPVQLAKASLAELAHISLAQNVPTLAGSLAAVRTARLAAERVKP